MTWTSVPKPAETVVVSQTGGSPIGLLLALTYAQTISSVTTGWGDIVKPTTYDWTIISKPTT